MALIKVSSLNETLSLVKISFVLLDNVLPLAIAYAIMEPNNHPHRIIPALDLIALNANKHFNNKFL